METWKICINLAQKASKKKEVPIGAVIIRKGKILAKSFNKREKSHDILSHAEISVIKKAAKRLKTWKLDDCDLYVTLKPCSMCENIIKQSRIRTVYYLLDKPEKKCEYYKTIFKKVENSLEENEYTQILTNFFKKKRHKKWRYGII